MKLGFIEEHPLMRLFPQGVDLLFLALGRKDVLLYTQHKKVFEMLGFGLVEASLPLTDGVAGDPHQVSQADLRQANARAQLQHSLSKGIVALTIGVPRHRCAPYVARDPAAPNQECEAKGKKDATLWWLTSPGTLAILRGVGYARG